MLTEAAVRSATPRIALGYAEASQIFGPGGGVFDDLPTDGTAVLVKSTYYGDTDLNRVINFDDYARLDAGFNNGGNTWFQGDFNYDGQINFDDYALIDLAFNTQSGALRAVPEPAAGILLFAALGLVRRRILRQLALGAARLASIS
jgi:hypothetical protein